MSDAWELIGQTVWDSQGVWVGHVVDIRMIKERGRKQGPQLAGLVVSRTRASFLLNVYRDANGKITGTRQNLTRLLYVRSRVVPWEMIDSKDTGEIHLKSPESELRRI